MRLFFALDLPSGHREALVEVQRRVLRGLDRARGLKPVGVSDWHLTLRFLGETSAEELARLEAGLESCPLPGPCLLTVEGVGRFPERGPASVLWVGVQPQTPLMDLQRALERRCVAAGKPEELRAFVPHITLLRAKMPVPPAQVDAALRPLGGLRLEPVLLDHCLLVSSSLGADGPRYEIVRRFPLVEASTGGEVHPPT